MNLVWDMMNFHCLQDIQVGTYLCLEAREDG